MDAFLENTIRLRKTSNSETRQQGKETSKQRQKQQTSQTQVSKVKKQVNANTNNRKVR